MEARDLALRESGGGGDKLMELCTAALLARLSRCAVFTRALEPTEGWFQHEQRALDSGSGALLRQCEKERTNIRTQRRREETQIAVADVGSKDAEERIRQLKDKTPQEPDRAASLQDTGGPLRDENGLLKAETVRPCAKRKRGPEHTKGRAQRPVAAKVRHRSFSRTQSQRTAAAAPRAGNGCRWFSRNPGVAGCARRGAFHASGQHSHARGRARVYDADLARTLFESVSRRVSNAAERRLSGGWRARRDGVMSAECRQKRVHRWVEQLDGHACAFDGVSCVRPARVQR
ncbi:hypothetical protein ERJ75_000645000 [Trypanosoma vivax]|nr:hypothetical protein ERJ75_000645000 [Trypanosoma vivax]